MASNLVYLLNAAENEEVADEILNFYANTPLNIQSNPSSEELENAINANPATPVILLISDNFLRSIDAMDGLSVLIQDPSEHLIPVLIEGRRLREGTQDVYESYPTKIGTIHEVMQYRDFWYEEWIRLRKQCNDAQAQEIEKLEYQKSIAKRISTNIGTFLRNVNGLQPMSWDSFAENDYKIILQHLGVQHLNELSATASPLKLVENEAEEIRMEVPLHEPTEELKTEEGSLDWEWNEEERVENVEEKFAENGVTNEGEEIVNEMLSESPEVAEIGTESPSEEENPLHSETREINELLVSPIKSEETTEHENLSFAEPVVNENVVPEEEEETAFLSRGLGDMNAAAAEAVYENMKLEEVTDLDVLFYVAEAEAEEGDFANARRCYERILSLDPTNGRALLWLARLLDKHFEGEKSTVNELYKKALFCNEETANLYYEYALHLKLRFQSLHRATDLLQRALELNPMFDLAYAELADCQTKLGQSERARANYLQACVLNPAFQSNASDAQYGVFRESPEPVDEESKEASLNDTPKHPNGDTVVMVTGATSGIGQAIAEVFALNGYKVIVTGRRVERLEELKLTLAAQCHIEMQTLAFDVRDVESINTALATLPEAWRKVDILINNAGLAKGRTPIHEGNLQHWEQMIDTNLKGLLYLTRAVAPGMVERKKGFIINIGSSAGKEVYPDGNVYCATKAAVDMLTKGMRLDLYKYGIRVAAVHPGHVDTEFALVRFDGNEEKAAIYDNFSPLTAYDVAETVYFVATRPARVNVQELLMFSTQQGSNVFVDNSGKKFG